MPAKATFRPRARAQRLAAGYALSAALLLGGCSAGVLAPKGRIAGSEGLLLFDATVTMLFVIVPVIVLTLAFGWWFRVGNKRATYRPDWSYSGRLEVVVWAVPALVVMFLGGMAWIATHELDPPHPIGSNEQPIDVEVVSLDWKWLFIYPGQGVASINQLIVPAGTPVRLELTSASVMNSFVVPQLAGQIYTMHGMTTRLNLIADRPGTFKGQSAQFSGDGFSDMRFTVQAMLPGEFASWVENAKASPNVLSASTYQQLLRPSAAMRQSLFGQVDPGMFEAIAAGNLPAGTGPVAGHPAPNISPRERH